MNNSEFIRVEDGEAGNLADSLMTVIKTCDGLIFCENSKGQDLIGFDVMQDRLSDGSHVSRIVLRFK